MSPFVRLLFCVGFTVHSDAEAYRFFITSVIVTRLHWLTCQKTIIFNHRISESSRLSLVNIVTDTVTTKLIITYNAGASASLTLVRLST